LKKGQLHLKDAMKRPFELHPKELEQHLEEMVDVTISDLGSEFLLMPAGPGFIKYEDFRSAYETLKRHTRSFVKIAGPSVCFGPLLE